MHPSRPHWPWGQTESSWWPPRRTPTARGRHGSLLPSPMSSTRGIVLHALLVDRMAEDVHTPEEQPLRGDRGKGGCSAAGSPRYRPTVPPGSESLPRAAEAGRISAAANKVFARNYRGWFKRLSDIGILGTCSVAPLPRAMARS